MVSDRYSCNALQRKNFQILALADECFPALSAENKNAFAHDQFVSQSIAAWILS
jgi:hypothetical protein